VLQEKKIPYDIAYIDRDNRPAWFVAISPHSKVPGPFGKLDEALARQGNAGPYFNGPKLSLVDAAYAPFLQRYTFMDRLRPLGMLERFPRLSAWRDALLAAPAVKASTVPNIEAVWQENLILRGRWLAKLVPESVRGAAAA
jgi:glutathione S-transferase